MTEKGVRLGAPGSGLNPQGAEDSLERDTAMTGTYAGVVAVEVVILLALWILGRMFL